MTLSREDARQRLQQHLEQDSYYLATTLLSNRLLRHGYAATAELFKDAGGFERAAGIWQACLTAIQGTPEGDIITNVLHSPYSCHMLSGLCDGGSSITYTIGLWHNFWHPEIICVGLPATVARLQINLHAERIAEGCPPPLNEPISGGAIAEQASCGIATNQVQFKICSDEAKAQFLPKAAWFNGGQDFSAIQMIWQDQQQRWPWEEGFSATEPQLLLVR